MLECEARTWLKNGYTTESKVNDLRKLLSQKRGPESAEKVV
ncbi:MAG: hypothetical protein R3260_00055 [Pseudomonas sp.]|nr:hypothetical protein [Pseudomonas sp.]